MWLSDWSELQTCIWSSWWHCHSLSLASVKSRLVLPFWYRLTWVVPEKGPLKGVCVYNVEDVSLIMTGRLYSSCVQSTMLHESETWPVRKENVVALQRAEMRMVRRMCGIKLKDRFPSKELRERLGIDGWHSIGITAEQAALVWACAAKRRWLGEEMHRVWSRGSKTKRKTQEDLERGLSST